jgi:hypothetical protein
MAFLTEINNCSDQLRYGDKSILVRPETKYTIIVFMVTFSYFLLSNQLQQPITQSRFGEDSRESIAYDWFEAATAARQLS